MFIIQLIIIQIITFAALVFALRKIMYSASYMETKRLEQLNAENVKKVQELTMKINEADKQCQEKIGSAEAEAKRLKIQSQEEIERLKEEILNKARQDAEHITASALNNKERIKEELEAKMLENAIDFSCTMLTVTLSSKNQKLLHEGLLSDVMQELDKIEPKKIQISVTKGELITPYEIEESKKEKLSQIISEKTNNKIHLEEKIIPEGIAGITIKLGSLIIDGSLRGKLKEAAERLKKDSR